MCDNEHSGAAAGSILIGRAKRYAIANGRYLARFAVMGPSAKRGRLVALPKISPLVLTLRCQATICAIGSRETTITGSPP